MIRRRALLAGGILTPGAAWAQKPPQRSPADGGWYARGKTKEQPVRFAGKGGVTLAGTLLLPLFSEIQYVPGMVLVAGSGPTDRNGNNPLAPDRIDLLKDIAELLARNGIASLRYDKRGIGQSTPRPRGSLEEQEAFFAWDNFVGDVEAAHAELLRHDEIKPYATALLGHSEGGLLALAASRALAAKKLHALVLAATPGRRLDAILRAQIARDAPPALRLPTDRAIAAILETGRVPGNLPPELQLLFPLYAGPFLQKLLSFDPAAVLAESRMPCLLVQGGADRQVVPMEDVQPLIDALRTRGVSGEAVVIPQVSHNLKAVTGPLDPGFAGPLSPAVAAALLKWLVPALGA
ncbi:MAG: alpha/beta fold hydrolase [Reyranella sp.]|uniref:alpha/beta hydrolase family protein n=1 Tax=Reyranella sp. TaxID=1929291 RepID=UPI0012229852|nr:alpha/beta fold hydrolase [Reyranella sp.]TAJ93062.1 MAG: alpha/beta fold hydrolase [Reyranella sp.]TBR29241.1 MAG: alpha/beta fold hydrolase [Reyranella sp.]